MKFIKVRLLILLLAIGSGRSYAQIKVKLAGKQYRIAEFKGDTVPLPFYLKGFIYPAPITQSRYPLEIRYYAFGLVSNTITLITLKGNKDSLILEREVICPIPFSTVAVKRQVTKEREYYAVRYIANSLTTADSLLNKLNIDGIFIQPDQYKVLSKLKARGVKLNPMSDITDCCVDSYVEVKLQNRYRSFTYSLDPASTNLQIAEFKQGGIITSDLWSTAYYISKHVIDSY
jgi:hypothetical protein